MTANEFQTVCDFEGNLKPGQEVLAKWSAGSGGHYIGKALVKKVNRASVRVALIETVNGKWGAYPIGREILCPLMVDSGIKVWAYFNRVEPVEGYQPVVSQDIASAN